MTKIKNNNNYKKKKNEHSSPINNSQKLEMAQISTNRKMDKQAVVYSYNGT